MAFEPNKHSPNRENDFTSALRLFMQPDESVARYLKRNYVESFETFIPLIDSVNLFPGSVIEIYGQSSSGKTEIACQIAGSLILPRYWDSQFLGGIEASVVYLDLDCRFHIDRLFGVIQNRFLSSLRFSSQDVLCKMNLEKIEALGQACLSRFSCMQCSDSFTFLSALKTIGAGFLEKSDPSHANSSKILIIDGVNAHYWPDKASTSNLPDLGKKPLSLSTVAESVVREINKLVKHKYLVILTNSPIFANQESGGPDFLSSIWKNLITHRLVVSRKEPRDSVQGQVFEGKWEKPLRQEPLEFTTVRLFIDEHGKVFSKACETGSANTEQKLI